MHYYKFNIADYRKDTGHLSTIEHGIFRQLIDWYYLDEQPISLETQVVSRRLRLGSDDLIFLENVLSDFFQKTAKGYVHKRIEFEIREYHEQAEKNKANGKRGGRPKKTQLVISGLPNESQNNPNQEPLTINHKPKREKATGVACPEDVGLQEWEDWLALRKAKKAPVTETVLKSARTEAEKAGMTLNSFLIIWCARGSQGLQADWLKTNERQSFAQQAADVARSTVPAQHTGRDPVLVKIEQERLRAVPPSIVQLEKMAEIRRSAKK